MNICLLDERGLPLEETDIFSLYYDLQCVINWVEKVKKWVFDIGCVARCYENTRERLVFILGKDDD